MYSLPATAIQELQQTILWRYNLHARSLPRRLTDDPYAIWISETMLCQTQVSRVVAYYHRRLQQIPDIGSLACIDRTTLLTFRSGLWYNSRALRLQQCARIIAQDHDGIVPHRYDLLIALPGIGRYIASAILAFAYHQDVAVVDTNIRRVLIARFELDHHSPDHIIWDVAQQTIPRGQAKLRRNAMMDYGAMVLTPQVTGIRSRYKQSTFEWSTRQVRSRIIRQLLVQDRIGIAEIYQQRPQHDIVSIIAKMCKEDILVADDKFVSLVHN